MQSLGKNVMSMNIARHIVAASIAVALFLPTHPANAADQKHLSDSSFTIDRSADGVPVYVTSRLPVDDLINRHIASWNPALLCDLHIRTKSR